MISLDCHRFFLVTKIASYRMPKQKEFMVEILLSAVGKVLKPELREQMK